MSCRNCGNKSRYQEVNPLPHQPLIEEPQPGFTNPLDAFVATKKLSYQELCERRDLQNRMMKDQADRLSEQMSEPMRHIYVDEMISIANCEKMFSQGGVTPEQAIITLSEMLERKEFEFVNEYYPGLKEAVSRRMEEIKSKRLPSRKL